MASSTVDSTGSESVLDGFVRTLGQPSTVAPVAGRLLSLLGEQFELSEELKSVVKLDPILTAVVLSVGAPITDEDRTVEQCWGSVAESELISALLGAAVAGLRAGDGLAGRQREMWRHCLAVGMICRKGAERLAGEGAEQIDLAGTPGSSVRASHAELAYQAGLVHELGKLALSVGMPKSLERARQVASDRGVDLLEAECAVFGFEHTALGRRLAGQMGLGRELRACIWLHHHKVDALPARLAESRNLQLVLFAEELARELGLPEPGDETSYGMARELGKKLGLDKEFADEAEKILAEQLDEAVETLGLDEPVGRQEFGGYLAVLAEHLGRLAGQLARTQGQLAKQKGDLSETEVLAEEFAEAGRKAGVREDRKRLDALLAEVASGAAHELNNPLAVISGRSQLLAAKETDQEKKEALKVIDEQTRTASEIVSDLLAAVRPGEASAEPTEVVPIIRKLCAALAGKAQESNSKVNCELSEDLPRAFIDPEMFEQSLLEILKNALASLGDKTGTIEVRCGMDETQEKLLLEVADSGIGMEADVAEKAFLPFFSGAKAGRGRGLGLTRAKAFVEANGGRLWLSSHPGQGTTVRMLLPVAKEG